MGKNKVTYANQEFLMKQATEKKPFKELFSFYKGNIAAILSFIATNRAAIFLGGCSEDEFLFWLGQQSIKNPELSGVISFTKGVVMVSWNALIANPNLCAIVVAGLVSLGATVVWGIKRAKLKHDLKQGVINYNDSEIVMKK